MKNNIKEIINILDQIIELLEWNGETYWLNTMNEAKRELLNSNLSGIETLLNLYGGMGSFTDLIIGHTIVNKQFMWKDGGEDKDKKLRILQSEAFDLATKIKRNVKKGK